MMLSRIGLSGVFLLFPFCLPAMAAGSYVMPDGINRAPAVALHCVGAGGGAAPCGTAANPLVVTSGPGASSAANQQQQIAAEQSSALGIGAATDPAFSGGSGSLVALLKAIWGTNSAGIPAVPVGGGLTSRTVALPATTSTQVFAVNPGRRYFSFQVPQGNAVWVNVMGGVAAPNGPDCAYFAAGTFYESGQFVNRGAITVYAPVAVTFSAWEG